MRRFSTLLFAVAAWAPWVCGPAVSTVAAQVTIGPDGVPRGPDDDPAVPAKDGPEVVEWTVSPAPLPVPPLKYRLTIPADQRRPGSAASYWYRAELTYWEGEAQRRGAEDAPSLNLAASELFDEPPASLTAERLREELRINDPDAWPLLDRVHEAALRPPADWGLETDSFSVDEFVSFLLPEFQNARALARIAAIRGRYRVGRGDFAGALEDATALYRLSEDCGRAPFFISDLVGYAIKYTADGVILEALIAAPGSPNLYYALAEAPDSVASLTDSWATEIDLPLRFAPWLEEAETLDWPADRWREELTTAMNMTRFSGDGLPEGAEFGFGTLLAATFPAARAALQEEGFEPAELDAMPAGKVLAIYQSRQMRKALDPYRVAVALPPREALAALDAAERAAREVREPLPLVRSFLPAAEQVMLAALRTATDTAALRAVEALRAHAAETGAFPDALEDVSVHVPDNPLTGAPFPYRLEDGVAVLEVVRHPSVTQSNRVIRLTLRDGPAD